jgi:hypothetical protein
VGDDPAVAADGGDEVGPEVVVGEEMVLGSGAVEVVVDITRANSGGEESSPGGSAVRRWCSEPEQGRSGLEYAVSVGLGGGSERAGGGVRRGGGT